MSLLQPPALAAVNLPDLGDVAQSELSSAQERRIGESIMRDIRAREPSYVDSPLVEDYLTALGKRLLRASPDPGPAGGFHFFLIRDPSLNAFALPGGYIGVHSGLILAAGSESELAGVLAHEMSHVTQRHIARLVGKQSQLSLGVLAGLVVAILAGNSQVGSAAVAATQAGAIQAQLGYTRDFEREADRMGFQMLTGSGFDPDGMSSFFEKLQRTTRLYDSSAPAYLRTHPLTIERISDMQNRAEPLRGTRPARADSLEFRLVRALLEVEAGVAREVAQNFSARLATAEGEAALVARYGLLLAHLRNNDLPAAAQAAAGFKGEQPTAVRMLLAELDARQGRRDEALAGLDAAARIDPRSRALALARIEANTAAGRSEIALKLIHAQQRKGMRDSRLFRLKAQAEAQRGRLAAQHRALAESYVLDGALPAAIEQLQLAQRAGDADFYELSQIDARLREVKRDYDQWRKESLR